MNVILSQLFPGKPQFTEKNLSSLTGKTYIVTGGNAGIGFDLVKILYSKNAIVYVAGRSPTNIATAIAEIKSLCPDSFGHLKPLHIDLADLNTVKSAATTFLAQESRLDVLFNNAGVAQLPPGSVTSQGYEIHMGTNCLGPFLLTQLLLPIILKTAASAPKDSVRVVWTSSGIIDIDGIPGGLSLEELRPGNHGKLKGKNYSASKAGNWFLGTELDKRVRKDGVVSITQTPGTLNTKSWDALPWIKILSKPFMHDPIFGAYTEHYGADSVVTVWCGLSPDVKAEDGGKYAIPWGRWNPYPNKLCLESIKSEQEGGTGVAAKFWDWCCEETKVYTASGL